MNVVVLHNLDNRFFSYKDGHRLRVVHVFETDDESVDPEILADKCFGWFNNGSGREDSLYFNKGLRSLSVGDVLILGAEIALACEPVGWKRVYLVTSQIVN